MSQTAPPERKREPRVEAGWRRLRSRPAVVALALAAATLLVYCPVLRNGFVNFDDPIYVTANAHVKGGLTPAGIAWAFRTGHTANWHPLTWLSHELDCQWYGLSPAGHHLTSLLFHCANAALLCFLLQYLTGARWRSAVVAALFALHPLHVESVAWVAERKDVLSAFFFFLTLLAYARYAQSERGTTGARELSEFDRLKRPGAFCYPGAVVLYALGLMSKPMLVTLPFVLLLLDYWPLGRFGRSGQASVRQIAGLLGEKVPFFALSIASCVVTFQVQREGGAVQSLAILSLGARVENALVAYLRYLSKAFWPAGLATPYPYQGHWPVALTVLAVVLLTGVTVAVVWGAQRAEAGVEGSRAQKADESRAELPTASGAVPAPHDADGATWAVSGACLVGWFWFLGMLVPVIGLVQVGDQSLADRYTYLPLVGVFIMVVWVADFWLRGSAFGRPRTPHSRPGADKPQGERVSEPTGSSHRLSMGGCVAVAVAIVVLAVCAVRTRQQLVYWRDTESLLRHATVVVKRNWLAHYNLACYLDGLGRTDEAITNYRKTVEYQPNFADAWNNLGTALAGAKQTAEAAACFERAVQLQPGSADFRYNLERTTRGPATLDEAIAQYREVLRQQPENLQALKSLGDALAAKREFTEAAATYETALRVDGDQPLAHFKLGNVLMRLRRLDEAIAHYRLALQQRPDFPEAQFELAQALGRAGRFDEAVSYLREVVKTRPADARVRSELGRALIAEQKFDEAQAEFVAALRLSPTNADAHANLGLALAVQGKLDQAIPHLEEALRYRPNDPIAHFNLGKALATEGKAEEARGHFEAALKLKPDYAEARKELEALAR